MVVFKEKNLRWTSMMRRQHKCTFKHVTSADENMRIIKTDDGSTFEKQEDQEEVQTENAPEKQKDQEQTENENAQEKAEEGVPKAPEQQQKALENVAESNWMKIKNLDVVIDGKRRCCKEEKKIADISENCCDGEGNIKHANGALNLLLYVYENIPPKKPSLTIDGLKLLNANDANDLEKIMKTLVKAQRDYMPDKNKDENPDLGFNSEQWHVLCTAIFKQLSLVYTTLKGEREMEESN